MYDINRSRIVYKAAYNNNNNDDNIMMIKMK